MNDRTPAAFFLLAALATSAVATEETQIEPIRAMGDLNGVALQCRYLEQTQKMKRALVETLPKRRELGQLFDDQTNKSFIAFMQQKQPCPSPAEFEQKVDDSIAQLKQAYSN